jgi:hypothetical protein
VQEQDAEQGSLLGGPEPDRLLTIANLEWPEDQELHVTAFDDDGATVPPASTGSPPALEPASSALSDPSSGYRDRKEREMTWYDRSLKWAAALALGLLGLFGAGAATVLATPAASEAASSFELTLDVRNTWKDYAPVSSQGTFTSRAPFCATGTFVNVRANVFTCDDGTGSLTVLWRDTTFQILDGSGSYAGLRGRGSVRTEFLGGEGDESSGYSRYRATFEGMVDRDAVAPSIDISKVTVTKLRRPAGAYSIKVALALHDNVEGNPVSYMLRVTATGASRLRGGTELARTFGIAETGAVSHVLRVLPLSTKAKSIRLVLTASDPVGNESSLKRIVRLPR